MFDRTSIEYLAKTIALQGCAPGLCDSPTGPNLHASEAGRRLLRWADQELGLDGHYKGEVVATLVLEAMMLQHAVDEREPI